MEVLGGVDIGYVRDSGKGGLLRCWGRGFFWMVIDIWVFCFWIRPRLGLGVMMC